MTDAGRSLSKNIRMHVLANANERLRYCGNLEETGTGGESQRWLSGQEHHLIAVELAVCLVPVWQYGALWSPNNFSLHPCPEMLFNAFETIREAICLSGLVSDRNVCGVSRPSHRNASARLLPRNEILAKALSCAREPRVASCTVHFVAHPRD